MRPLSGIALSWNTCSSRGSSGMSQISQRRRKPPRTSAKCRESSQESERSKSTHSGREPAQDWLRGRESLAGPLATAATGVGWKTACRACCPPSPPPRRGAGGGVRGRGDRPLCPGRPACGGSSDLQPVPRGEPGPRDEHRAQAGVKPAVRSIACPPFRRLSQEQDGDHGLSDVGGRPRRRGVAGGGRGRSSISPCSTAFFRRCWTDEMDHRVPPRGVRQSSSSRCRAMFARVGGCTVRAAMATSITSSSLSRRRGDRARTCPSTNPFRASRRTVRASAAPVHGPPSGRREPCRSRLRATTDQGRAHQQVWQRRRCGKSYALGESQGVLNELRNRRAKVHAMRDSIHSLRRGSIFSGTSWALSL